MIARIVLCAFVAVSLGACADLTTIGRRSTLPDGGYAVHLDPTQRLVYSSKNGIICAEPSPDALQSIAASSGLGLSLPSQGSVSLAAAIQASAASFGLRTQSITLMRDELYRICEQGFNGNLKGTSVLQMMQRSQDLTLGVLAIEQLTGAVVAKQVALSAEANATASANIANTQKQLDRAQATEDEKNDGLAKAEDAKKVAHEAADKSKKAFDDATKASPLPKQEELDKLKKQQQDDQTAADKADTATTAAKKDYELAQKATQAIRDNLNAAITNASATAKGAGSFGGDILKSNIDKDTVASLASATTEIVRLITEKGHILDSCMNIADSQISPDVKKWCNDAIAAYLKAYSARYVTSVEPSPVAGGNSTPQPMPRLPAPPPEATRLPPQPAMF